jgi:hypothetical protein
MNLDKLVNQIEQWLTTGNQVTVKGTSMIEVWLNNEFQGTYFIGRRELYFALKHTAVEWA